MSLLAAPPLARWLGWQAVYAVAGNHPRAEACDGVLRQGLATVTVTVSLGVVGFTSGSIMLTTLLLLGCFAALGAGNGALFQLVPRRWPTTTAVVGSMIGEIGALAGGLVPNAMGLSKQVAGTYAWGFVLFALLGLLMLCVRRLMQVRWTRTWADKGGHAPARRTHDASHAPASGTKLAPGSAIAQSARGKA